MGLVEGFLRNPKTPGSARRWIGWMIWAQILCTIGGLAGLVLMITADVTGRYGLGDTLLVAMLFLLTLAFLAHAGAANLREAYYRLGGKRPEDRPSKAAAAGSDA